MEEAYHQLYQQFCCLRSLCLRQASLLNQLSAALQKQQEATVPRGEPPGTRSTPGQENQQRVPEEQTSPRHVPAGAGAQCGCGGRGSALAAPSSLLAPQVAELQGGREFYQTSPNQEAQDLALAQSLETLGWQRASSTDPKVAQPLDQPDATLLTGQIPASDGSFLADDLPGQSDGMLMSDVALQSHMCDFCQAVFPGDTTTRGEFLRHLYTHVT